MYYHVTRLLEATNDFFFNCFLPVSSETKEVTVYTKKYAHSFCFAVLCCGYTLTDFPISIRLTSLALWQSSDCPSASKATLMNMDKYFMWILYERLRNHNKAKNNKIVCIFLGIYCIRMEALQAGPPTILTTSVHDNNVPNSDLYCNPLVNSIVIHKVFFQMYFSQIIMATDQ